MLSDGKGKGIFKGNSTGTEVFFVLIDI